MDYAVWKQELEAELQQCLAQLQSWGLRAERTRDRIAEVARLAANAATEAP